MSECQCKECKKLRRDGKEPTRPNKYYPENYYATAYKPLIDKMLIDHGVTISPYRAAMLAEYCESLERELNRGE